MFRATSDTLSGALATLAANKLRSALTLLGIVIGISSVVAMSATLEGLRRAINTGLSQLGTGVFQVQKWPVMGGGGHNRAKYEKRKNFVPSDVRLLEDKCSECLRVGGEAWAPPQKLSAGENETRPNVWVVGGTEHVIANNGYSLASGRLLTVGECESGGDVIVMGSDVAEVLFPGGVDPLGKEVRLGRRNYRVVGVLERRGASIGPPIDNIVALPLATFLLHFGDGQSLNLTIQARDPERLAHAQDQVASILRRARGVPPEAENDFEIFSNDSMQETFETIAGTIVLASLLISGISLLVGGIGVMNIMLVAVTERTNEIGVRRALGARRRRILAQFLAEAILLTILGGIMGILLGVELSRLIEIFSGIHTVAPMQIFVISVIVSGVAGLAAGIYPAWRASQLDPVEAMRHE